ncbi:MAG: D-amino acid dehydrogenase [Gammaproteobacteria bacterium]|nr:D-amino acid dehydrogenase [Gammaproteobacteria bacterium]
MRVVVLGGGVIGVTTAYYLAENGHQVILVDRQKGPALETSYANASQISPGYAAPWAGPGVPLKVIQWMLQPHSPLVIRLRLDPAMWRWLFRMLLNCTRRAYETNKERMQRLAHYSRACLERLRDDTGIQYDQRTLGTLQLFRTQKMLDAADKDVRILQELGVDHSLLDRAGCLEVEPGLSRVSEKVTGGLHLPGDETGDCYKFTRALSSLAAERGVEFRYRTQIEKLVEEDGRIIRTITDKGPVDGDVFVVAMGCYSYRVLRPLGVRVRVYPIKGYSITVPVIDDAAAPRSTIMDEAHKVAVTRIGDRIRAAGTAELNGFNLDLPRSRCDTIIHVVDDLFPDGGDTTDVKLWTGLRPMNPDGTPTIGPTRYPNLFVNTGHGTLGWTMACGSGRVVADLVSGKQPEIDMDGLTLARYG